MIAVLAEVDTLPGAQRQASILYRQLQLKTQQTALEVRRQIVRPFVIVFVTRLTLWHQTVEKALEIAAHRGVGVLVHR